MQPGIFVLIQAKQGRYRPIALLIAGLTILVLLHFAPQTYFSGSNLLNILRQISVPGMIAAGMTIVVIGAGFDLSVGAVAALAGVLAVGLTPRGIAVALLAAFVSGALCGLANGLLIWRTAVHPLIVTLGMRYIIYSAATVYTHGFIQVNHNPAFLILGRATLLGIPLPVLLFLAIIILLQAILGCTVFGSVLYAIGNNERAAFYSGIVTHRYRVLSYVVSSLCASLGGIILASRSGAAAPDVGQGYELDAIAAVAIGGVSLLGGSGSLWRALIGVSLFGVVNNVLVLARQPYEARQIAIGVMIILALAVDSWLRKNKA